MTPADATTHLQSIRVVGADVRVRWTNKMPEAIEALRSVKPGILQLDGAATAAGCSEPLLTLVREFRMDLEHITAGMYTQAALVDAIRTIGAVDGWQFESVSTRER